MFKKQPSTQSILVVPLLDPVLIQKKIKGISLAFVVFFQMVPPSMAFAQEGTDSKSPDKSSYMGGTIEAEMNGKAFDLPKLKSAIHADIKGNIATVTVEQTFLNPSKSPVHARYLFPLDHNSAVYSMTMETPHELVQAKIQKKEEAKKTFEAAKKDGKAASLLEQERPNMFTQNIANLMPNQPVKVTLKYVEPISKIDGSYELVIPLIVGPRYEPQKMTLSSILPSYPGVAGLNLPKSIEEDRVSVSVDLDAGLPVQMIKSPSHRIVSTNPTASHQVISFEKGKVIDNKDFVLRYNVSGKATQAGFMTQQDSHGKFFNLTIEPPAVPQSSEITPREMVFVLDTSGSMSGFPLDASKTFMHQALKTLRKTDYFRIVRFSNQASEFSKGPVLANPENLRQGNEFIDHLTADGGTETESGIHQALDTSPPENTMRIVVFLTDGYIGNEYDVLKLLGQKIGSARLYAFGVGDSVNRFLLDEMGRMGHGSARYVLLNESPEAAALDLANKLATPVLTDISVDWNTFKTQSVFPQKLPDLFAGDAIHLQGKYLNEGKHTIFVHGKIQGRKVTLPVQISVAPPLADASHLTSTPLSLMWARTQIGELMLEWTSPGYVQGSDVDQASLQAKVTNLGLEYALMTQWTSFVAVSQKKVNPHPENASEQSVPLPMVSGVSDKAYAASITGPDFSGSSVPEPENNLMLILLLLVLIGAGLYSKQKDKNPLRLFALANKSNHSS